MKKDKIIVDGVEYNVFEPKFRKDVWERILKEIENEKIESKKG